MSTRYDAGPGRADDITRLCYVTRFDGEGYAPVVDFQAWRVAILNYHPELLPEAIETVHCHDETDEVFTVIEGRCLLILGEPVEPDGTALGALHAVELATGTVYTVRRGVWHSHTLDRAGKVLIVENRDTGTANSRELCLTGEQRGTVRQLCAEAGFRSSPS